MEFYHLLVSPFEFCFLDETKFSISVINYIIFGLFLVDLILGFFIAYHDKQTHVLIDDPKKIAKKHSFRFGYLVDILSIIPPEIVQKIPPHKRVFNVFCLWHLKKFHGLFLRLETKNGLNYVWTLLAEFFLVIIYYVHFSGCISFYIASHFGDSKDTLLNYGLWRRYLISIIWATSSTSTTGYDYLLFLNKYVMLFEILYKLATTVLAFFLIGGMSNLVVYASSSIRKYRDSFRAASGFAQMHQFPSLLRKQILAYYEALEKQDIVDSLPKTMRASISKYLYSRIKMVYLFNRLSGDLLSQLVYGMKAEFYSPKEDVILQNETPTDFFLIIHGSVDLIQSNNDGIEQVVGKAEEGDVCGEVSVLYCRPQLFTVRTRVACELLRVNRTILFDVAKSDVAVRDTFKDNLSQHLNQQTIVTTSVILDQIRNILSQGKLDLPVNLCVAAKDGNARMMDQLLKHEADPNESDDAGRTALHFSALYGNEACVRLLLEYGADPNRRDNEGISPQDFSNMRNDVQILKLFEAVGSLRSRTVSQLAEVFPIQCSSTPKLSEDVSAGSSTMPRKKAIAQSNSYPSAATRVTISGVQESGKIKKVMVLLPNSFEELRQVAASKLGFFPLRVESESGAEIDCIEVIRDGDHLILIKEL